MSPMDRINFLHLQFLRYGPDKIFKFQGHNSQVKSRSHHDVVHLHTSTDLPTKYQRATPCGFKDTAQTRFRFLRSRSLQQGQIVVSKILPGQDF